MQKEEQGIRKSQETTQQSRKKCELSRRRLSTQRGGEEGLFRATRVNRGGGGGGAKSGIRNGVIALGVGSHVRTKSGRLGVGMKRGAVNATDECKGEAKAAQQAACKRHSSAQRPWGRR